MATFTEYSYGGRTYAFTDLTGPVCRMFECPICQGVVQKAYSVKCCKKTFCKGCLDEALKKFDKCPMCRAECPVTYENDAIDDGVNDFKVLCIHHAKGCEWSGHLLHEPKHREDTCGYEEVKCEMWEMGCEVVDERRYMEGHVVEECKYRNVHCQYCWDIQRAWEMEIHLLSCPDYPVACFSGCQVEGLLRKNIDSHQQVCPEAVVDCPFAEMGCKEVQLKRKDVESHTTSAMSHHLALVMKNCVEAKQTMQKHTDAHEIETQCLKARIDQLQLEADDHRNETEYLKARTDQLELEAGVYRTQTECLKAKMQQLRTEAGARRTETAAVINKLQVEVSAVTKDLKDITQQGTSPRQGHSLTGYNFYTPAARRLSARRFGSGQ